MSVENTRLPVDLVCCDDALAYGLGERSGADVAEELAALCEALAQRLQARPACEDAATDPRARLRMNFVYGTALLRLAERDGPALLPDAVRSLSDALSLARRHVPERVVTVKSQLLRAEHSLVLAQTAEHAR